MQAIAIAGIGDWIRRQDGSERHEAMLYGTVPYEASENRWRDARDRATALFLMVFAHFVRDFGEPDFPAESGCDWRKVLGLRTELVAVWDFDYYQISLRVESQSSEDSFVVLTVHHNERNAPTDRPSE